MLSFVDPEEDYRRGIKGMRNLQEGRHDLARHVFHGRRGELARAYRDGIEDQLGALGLVLNAITLWNTVHLDAAVTQLRQAYPVLDVDAAHLSPYMCRHINIHSRYAFPVRAGGRELRRLRDPDVEDTDDDTGS